MNEKEEDAEEFAKPILSLHVETFIGQLLHLFFGSRETEKPMYPDYL
jgi:hypothetical protein